MQSPEIREKGKATQRKKYGGLLYIQTEEARKKLSEKCKETKPFKHGRYIFEGIPFDSSYEIAVYHSYKKKNILLERNPECDLTYINEEGKEVNYYPDFKDPRDGHFIEVKAIRFMRGESYVSLLEKYTEIISDRDGSIEPFLEEAKKDFGGKNWYIQFRRKN